MKLLIVAGLLLLSTNVLAARTLDDGVSSPHEAATAASALRHKKWIHGAADCKSNRDPAIEVFRYDESSYILRQNKCLSFEAPFLYLLLGDERALLLDTGATRSAADFPLYTTVRALIDKHSEQGVNPDRALLVIHSHGHRDHYRGDAQFEGMPNVVLLAPSRAALLQFFAFSNWPDGEAQLELGGRTLTILATPGHQEEAITVYDPQTKWLLTGDTFYPGYITVKHWNEYRNSIGRLASFVATHEVSAVLGAHIEMTDRPGEYYAIGTVHQPEEAPLPLTAQNLLSLDSALQKSRKPQKLLLPELVVAPMNFFQKALSNTVRWVTQ